MNDADVAHAAREFEAHRGKLFGIAYRMLGVVGDAEDAVQDAYLRYASANPQDLRSTEAFLVTVITRLCLDRIKRAQAQREVYVGPWLPEPLMTDLPPEARDPADRAADLDSISTAFVLLLQNLSAEERAAFLLHEVFDYSYTEIAAFLDKSEAACRQLVSRARRHIAEHRPRIPITPEEHQRVLHSFMQAVGTGDLAGLMQLMSDDVQMVSDGGGKAAAATRPLLGPEHVGKFIIGLPRIAARTNLSWSVEVMPINGRPALVVREDGRLATVYSFDVSAGRIRGIYAMRNPDKLTRLNR
jgi:RNA polymerase sigma-70 factor (ECF subfamily)